MAGYLSKSFDPEEVAAASDAASSAIVYASGASDTASAAMVKAAAASSKILAQSSAWEAGGGGHAAVTLSADAGANLLQLDTQQIGLDPQTANYLFAGPVSGGAVAPGFRALVNADIPSGLSPSITGLTLSGLTASRVVVTDGSKNLASGTNTDADIASAVTLKHAAITLAASAEVLLGLSTQALSLDTQTANYIFVGPASGSAAAPTFRAMVAADLGTTLSPTFNQGNFTTLHTTTILADHIGEHTGANNVVFDNTVALPAVTTIPDAGTIGLGVGDALIQFDNEVLDTISFLNCCVILPAVTLVPANSYIGLVEGGKLQFAANTVNDLCFLLCNVGIGTGSFGTNASGVICMAERAAAPSSSPANCAQLYVEELESDNAGFVMRTEKDEKIYFRVLDHIADATSAATVITQLNALLAALESLGWIASS